MTDISDRTKPRCLILLATYNGAEFIEEQLESILTQQDIDVRIQVSDDASTDRTCEIIQNFVSRDDRIRLLVRKTGTGSAAQNFIELIRETDISEFDYVALSDHDDIWLPGKLRRAIAMLRSSNAGGYSCSVLARWPDGRESVFQQSGRLRDADYLFEGAGQGCGFVGSRNLFTTVQRVFRARPDLTAKLIYHDWAIYALARSYRIRWLFDTEPMLVYRQHQGNDTGARRSIAGIRRRLRMLQDGRYCTQVASVSLLCLEVASQDPLPHQWLRLDASGPGLLRRARKAIFCMRYGRRKFSDRALTAMAALAGWI